MLLLSTNLFFILFVLAFGGSLITLLSLKALKSLGDVHSKNFLSVHRSDMLMKKFLSIFHQQNWFALYKALHATSGATLLFFMIILGQLRFACHLSPKELTLASLALALSFSLLYILLLPLACRHSRSFLQLIKKLSHPIIILLLPLTLLLSKLYALAGDKRQTAEDTSLEHKINEVLAEIPHSPDEKRLLLSVVNFQERTAREVMVPRREVFALPLTMTQARAAEQIAQEGYSRVPIYDQTVDRIVGVIRYKDLMHISPQTANEPISLIKRDILFAPECKPIYKLLQEFRGKRNHIAVVVDEYGGTVGIVTIEDVIEALIGDVRDEYDDDEKSTIVATGIEGEYLVDATTSIHELERELEIKLPESTDYDTLGGFILHRARRIPRPGFTLYEESVKFRVEDADARSIKKIRIFLEN